MYAYYGFYNKILVDLTKRDGLKKKRVLVDGEVKCNKKNFSKFTKTFLNQENLLPPPPRPRSKRTVNPGPESCNKVD